MDKDELLRAGNDILEDVMQAIESNQYSDLGQKIRKGSLCALGQTAHNPVLSTLRYFRSESEAHVKQKTCPAKVCSALCEVRTDETKCIKCNLCRKNCPAGAISPEIKVDNSKCIRCNACIELCPKKAISRVAKTPAN